MAEASVRHRTLSAEGLLPWQVAASWNQSEGLAYLDSSLQKGAAVSWLGINPQDVFSGNLKQDLPDLERFVEQSQGRAGALMGWIEFDGHYTLAHYPVVYQYDHANESWLGETPPRGQDVMVQRFSSWQFGTSCLKQQFEARVQRVLEYIAAGDIYQVNLSHPWFAPEAKVEEAWAYYQRLREVSPVNYGAYVNLNGTRICCSSPESFLKFEQGRVITKPIKGTRPRSADILRDQQLADELLNSAKERAELVMITDLLRNDLGQVCQYGSVEVEALCALEQYAQVQHLVSTVSGRLRQEVRPLTALSQCFPGGSISGAPKKRALEIITELEGYARGPYTGALGYLDFKGNSQWNILIRTAWFNAAGAHFCTGAGIVADSVPALEWEETLHKAAGMLAASAQD